MFCREGFGYEGETPDEETIKAAYEHESKCPLNPYLQKLDAQAELIAGLQESLKESEARVAGLLGEVKRLREALVKISAWGCNGQCVELCGTKCPCCMAQEALVLEEIIILSRKLSEYLPQGGAK
jgi:hypothetical protein